MSGSQRETGQPPQSYRPPQRQPSAAYGPPRQFPRPKKFRTVIPGRTVTRRLNLSLIAIGAVLVLGALAALTQQWAWSWHNASGGTFTLAHMHGVCTSALGELAQGVSGSVASNCTRIDSTWTLAVAGLAVGVIVGAVGIVRMRPATTKPQ